MSGRIATGGTMSKLTQYSLALGLLTAVAPESRGAGVDPRDVVGKFAHFDVVAYDDKQLLGTMKSMVITYGITEFLLEGEHLIERDTFCHAEHKSNLPVHSQVPDEFTRNIVPRTAEVTVGNGTQSWDFWRPETPTGIGVHFDDPVTDAMPKNARDERISDDDEDGHPGVTVYLTSGPVKGQLYLARRERFAYELRYITQDLLQGVVHDSSEQVTLGSQPFFLSHGRYHPVQHGDLSKSPITLKRLPQQYDCDSLMAERDQWFPPVPSLH